MAALAIVMISAAFVLAAMAGLTDAIVCFACAGLGRLIAESRRQKPEQTPAQGIP